MAQVTQIVRLVPATGQRETLLAALEAARAAASGEPGTTAYAIHARHDSDEIWVYELYRDDDAYQAHSASAATARLREAFATALAAPPDVCRASLVASFGMSL